MKKILVTGGAGFIGSNLCEALLDKGYFVVSIDNFNDFYSPKLKEDNIKEVMKNKNSRSFISIRGDICDKNDLESIFRNHNITCVIHLAARAGVRQSLKEPLLYEETNIRGTLNILECLRKYKVKNYIFASSSSVYGNNKKVPFSENDSVDSPISPYAATKRAAELLNNTYHYLYKINTINLRLFTVYGPRQRPDLAIHKFTKRIFEGRPIEIYGDGTSSRDYTYIKDTVNGIMGALDFLLCNEDKKIFEIINLGNSHPVSLSKLIKLIQNITGKKAKIRRLPMQPGDVEKTYADISKAKRILGFCPEIKIEDGIAEFVQWYRKTMM